MHNNFQVKMVKVVWYCCLRINKL